MRVLFVTTTYPLRSGDPTPSFVADLAEGLVRDHGVRVRVIAPHHGGAAKSEVVNGVEIERFQYALDPAGQCVAYGGGVPDNLKNFPRAKWQLPGFFAAMTAAVWRNAEWAELIHAHWIEPAFLSMAANRFGRPVVISVHSVRKRAKWAHRFTLGRADRVLFNSHYTMELARQKGYFPCRGQVLYQGYDDRLFGAYARGNGARERLGIGADAPLMVALGRLVEFKGFHVLARAADRILSPHPDAHLVIAGDGPMRGTVEGLLAKSACRDRVHVVGAVSRDQAARLLADADLFVNPGVIDSAGHAEPLGITTMEAMASGLPVVGSAVGGLTETIADGETGLLVPHSDIDQLAGAVGRLLTDHALRRSMGAAARRLAKARFTWSVLAGEVSKVYGEVRSV